MYTVAHGSRTPGTIKCTTFWLFHRNCPLGHGVGEHLQQLFQHLGLPRRLLAGRKTLCDRCHFWPSTFHGITSSGFCSTRSVNFWKPATARSRNDQNSGVSISCPRVDVDLHFLPRAAEVLALHPRAAAVGSMSSMSLSGLRSSSATSVSRSNVFFAVRNFSFRATARR